MKIMDELKKLLVRRNHKDSMFCDLFSRKENALSLYNAIRGTDYDDPDGLQVVTIKDVIYMHRKNDVSILFDHKLTLWEHQSTLNRNMPLRGLIYYAHNVEGILDEKQKKKLYRKAVVNIPAPEYYVFYNGTEEVPEVMDLKLSDAFETPSEGYEWTAHMININAGHNVSLMEKCPTLKGYAFLIQEIREGRARGLDEKQAVEAAIKKAIEKGYLKEYLSKIRAEAKTMLLTEFDEKAYEETIREESYEEGKIEGKAEGRAEGKAEGKAEAKAEDIRIFISDKREDGRSDEEIRARIKKYYGLDDKELDQFF